jgi:multidrug resistance protein
VEQRHRAAILMGVSAAAFLGPFTQTVYAPSLVEIGHYFQVSQLAVNWTISGWVLVLAVAGFIVGPLADRFGRRAVLLTGLVIFTIGSLLCLVAQRYGWFLAGRMVAALGISACVTMAAVVIGDIYAPDERTDAMSVYQLLAFLGPVAGPVVGGVFASYLPWQWIFALLTVLSIVVLIGNARILPETRPAAAAAQGTGMQGLGRLLRSRPAWALFLLGFTQLYAYYAFLVHLPVLLHDQPLSTAEKGLAFLPLTVGLLVGVRLSRWLVGRWHRTLVVNGAASGLAVAVLALAGLLAINALPLPLLLLFMLLFGLLLGSNLPPQMAILVNLFSAEKGAAVGAHASIRFTGGALGPVVSALIGRHFGNSAVIGALGIVLLIVAVLVWRWLEDPYERPGTV